MSRDYVVPTSSFDIPLTEWKDDFKSYGVDLLMLVSSVMRAYLKDEANPAADLMHYISQAIQRVFDSSEIGLSSSRAIRAYEEEVDRMTLVSLDAAEAVQKHLKPYFDWIEKTECDAGHDPLKITWSVAGYVGEDVVIRIHDEGEHDPHGDPNS